MIFYLCGRNGLPYFYYESKNTCILIIAYYVCLHQQATADTCRMMGNRAFMDLISVNEIHKAAVEPQDLICMRDYMQVENKHPSNYFTTRFQWSDHAFVFILFSHTVFQPHGRASSTSRWQRKRMEVPVSKGAIPGHYAQRAWKEMFWCRQTEYGLAVKTSCPLWFFRTAALAQVFSFILH